MEPCSALEKWHVVAIEGIDGSGKTAVAEQTVELLRAWGAPAILAGEKQSPLAHVLRDESLATMTPIVKTLVFAADRAWTLAAKVPKSSRDGALIVWDRYVASALVYREAELPYSSDGLTLQYVETVNAIFPRPDLTVLLSLDVEQARARTRERATVYDAAFLRKVSALYQARAAREGWITIDGAPPVGQVAGEVAAQIRASFKEFFS